ncbi:MAG: histidine kinase N-terminal 7TM domain-containing protein [Chloroflexota bacterium]|nr:histidine kinase N-terminal 7TM domain-containing protein [Chloroflexota bacterium]
MPTFIGSLQTFNQLLTAGIAITAFSLLLYVLSFNLRDRVARSVAIIFLCVVVIFVGDAIVSITESFERISILVKLQWVGIIFLSPSYLHFSDALLATTGRPSRGRRRRLIWLTYFIATAFVAALPFPRLSGSVNTDFIAPHLKASTLIWVFAFFYTGSMIWAWVNFWRAYKRAVTSTSRRRMRYLIAGALAPALGAFPYMTYGSRFTTGHPLLFWLSADIINIFTAGMIVLMAYGVAFFGVSWPDRVVKRRLFKWVMRGPVTASTVLAVTTVVRRAGESLGSGYSAAVPITMVGTLLLMQYAITMLAPIWELWLFYGGARDDLQLVQTLEERLLTTADLRQFLESILTAVCDRLQVNAAFGVVLFPPGLETIVTVGDINQLEDEELSEEMLRVVTRNCAEAKSDQNALQLFSWGDYWLVPLFEQHPDGEEKERTLLGLLGTERIPESPPDDEQRVALETLAHRAALALEDRSRQQQVFNSLQSLTPQVDWVQRLRAASRYGGTNVLTITQEKLAQDDLAKWVKDALRHYWGGPKLTKSPLLRLQIVQHALDEHDGVSVNALRSILRKAVEHVRPEGKRRFTSEWILFNILELKFMEGRKVRDVAKQLAMSEADLYRKQRSAIEAVAEAIISMERDARIDAVSNG